MTPGPRENPGCIVNRIMRPRLQSSALDDLEPVNTSAMDPAPDVTSFLGINPEGDDETLAAGKYGPQWAESGVSAAPYATYTLKRTSLAFVLNSVPVLSIVLLTTVYLLFANDIRLLAFSASADVVFEVLSSACLFVFLLELVVRSWVETKLSLISVPNRSGKIPVSMAARTMDAAWRALCCGRRRRLRVHGYAFSILFLLDIVAIISILPEIRWIWGDQSVVSSNLSTTRASRAARVGARWALEGRGDDSLVGESARASHPVAGSAASFESSASCALLDCFRPCPR